MFRTFSATREYPCDSNRADRRAKLDVITAAMLTGGASGGWGMARALKSQAAHRNRQAAAYAVGEVQAEMTVRSEPGRARTEPDPGSRLRLVAGPGFKAFSESGWSHS
jgi:hypothetical protein